MQPAREFHRQRFMHRAGAGHAGLATEDVAHQMNREMRLAFGTRAGMTGVAGAVVLDLEQQGRETREQAGMQAFGSAGHVTQYRDSAALRQEEKGGAWGNAAFHTRHTIRWLPSGRRMAH